MTSARHHFPDHGPVTSQAAGPRSDDVFDFNHLMNGLAATVLVGVPLVLAPTVVAVPALVSLAFACGRLGGRDAGLASVSAGALMFAYAITEPHFRWAIDRESDVVLLLVLLAASAVAAEYGARRRPRQPAHPADPGRRLPSLTTVPAMTGRAAGPGPPAPSFLALAVRAAVARGPRRLPGLLHVVPSGRECACPTSVTGSSASTSTG